MDNLDINKKGKLLGVKKWAIILFIFGFLVVLSQYSTDSSNQITNKYQLFKFNNNKEESEDVNSKESSTNRLSPQVHTVAKKIPVNVVENYINLSDIAQKLNSNKTTETESTTNAATKEKNHTVSFKMSSVVNTTANNTKVNVSINNDYFTTAAFNAATTKSIFSKTTEIPRNHFPFVKGMYNMSRFLKLPPPVPIRSSSKEPLLNYPQKRDYPQLLKLPNKCGRGHKVPVDFEKLDDFDYDSEMFLLMAVKSSCSSRGRRDAVRQTWGNETWVKQNLNVNLKLVFLLGSCTSESLSKNLKKEHEDWMDILQWDFHDSFGNLTLKEVLFLQWFTKTCQNVPYVFKGDDDVFVNTKNIVEYLRKEVLPEKRKDLFVGSVLVGSPRILDPTWKYYVSYNLFPEKYYPPYVSGGGFLLSSDVIVRIFSASMRMRIFPIDDAFVGTLLKSCGIKPNNDPRFKSWGISPPPVGPCRLSKVFTFHKSLPTTLVRQWKDVLRLDRSKCDPNYNVMASQTR